MISFDKEVTWIRDLRNIQKQQAFNPRVLRDQPRL